MESMLTHTLNIEEAWSLFDGMRGKTIKACGIPVEYGQTVWMHVALTSHEPRIRYLSEYLGKIIGRAIIKCRNGDGTLALREPALMLEPFPKNGTIPGKGSWWQAPKSLIGYAKRVGYRNEKYATQRIERLLKTGMPITANQLDRIYNGKWRYENEHKGNRTYSMEKGESDIILICVMGKEQWVLDDAAHLVETSYGKGVVASLSTESQAIEVKRWEEV